MLLFFIFYFFFEQHFLFLFIYLFLQVPVPLLAEMNRTKPVTLVGFYLRAATSGGLYCNMVRPAWWPSRPKGERELR